MANVNLRANEQINKIRLDLAYSVRRAPTNGTETEKVIYPTDPFISEINE